MAEVQVRLVLVTLVVVAAEKVFTVMAAMVWRMVDLVVI
jgi:hypothetical protein